MGYTREIAESARIVRGPTMADNAVTVQTGEGIRQRLRDLLYERRLSHAQMCRRLTQQTGEEWRVQRFGKLMNGIIHLRVEDLAVIAEVAGLSLVEIVREPGKEFVADLTPSELRVLNLMRDHPHLVPHLTALLAVGPKPRGPSRRTIRERMARNE